MKTLTDPGAKRAAIGIGTLVVLAFASGAAAMQEYEDLKTLVAEIEMDIWKADQQVGDLEDVGILQVMLGSEPLSQILVQVDSLEYSAVSVLSAVAATADAEGNKAAGTRVRKQMQKIKQAAQEVRNRVLELRVALAPLTQFPPYLPAWIH